MPTYDDLRWFFEKRDDLRKIAGRSAEVSIVTGITIDIDPAWALIHDVGTGLIHRGALAWLEYPWFTDFVGLLQRPESVLYGQYQGYRRRDLGYSDPHWEHIQQSTKVRSGYDRLPVIMTVVHQPMRTPTMETGFSDFDDQAQLRTLIAIINEARVLVRVEERPAARFAFAAGDEITTSGGRTGTLGGVLRDASVPKSYGLTCAHVAATNDRVMDGSGNVLGQCVADTGRVPLSGKTVCDPIYLPLPQVNTLDCSLVDLTATVSMPQLGGIAGCLSPGQDVVLESARNRIRCKLGSLAISYNFSENKQDYCFRDVIELLPQPWGPFGGTLGRMTTTIPTQGDSGSWVLTDDPVPVWAGLFFGEDGQRGFAIRAYWVHGWAETTLGVSLTI